MFNSKFVEELFRPQELYPKKAVKHIFEKLAHSSIMRLNEASMDKVCYNHNTKIETFLLTRNKFPMRLHIRSLGDSNVGLM